MVLMTHNVTGEDDGYSNWQCKHETSQVLKNRINYLQGITGGNKAIYLNDTFVSLRKNIITYLFTMIYSMPAMCQELC